MRSYASMLMAVLLYFGCADHRPDHGEPDTSASVPGLATDNGRKWQMDEHTREMFAVMAHRITEHKGELKPLGEALEDDLDKLVRGCTMTGSAHDELHRFLIHYVPAVSNLADSGAEESFLRVKKLLEAYPMYFE